MSDLDLGGDAKVDPELQEFLLIEKQKAQVNAQVRNKYISSNLNLNLFHKLIV